MRLALEQKETFLTPVAILGLQHDAHIVLVKLQRYPTSKKNTTPLSVDATEALTTVTPYLAKLFCVLLKNATNK